MSNLKRIDRKHPVHMTPVERYNASVILLLTLCARTRTTVFDNDAFHRAFLKGVSEADAWSVGLYVIMPDHIHLFCRPATEPRVEINTWSTYLKKRVSHAAGVHDWRWLPDCWDRQMRNAQHYEERYAYVVQNPVRAGLVPEPGAWPYQGVVNILDA